MSNRFCTNGILKSRANRKCESDKKAVRCEKRKMKRDEKLWEGKE